MNATNSGELTFLAVDDAARAEPHHVVALGLVGDDADRVGAGGRAKLHAEHPEAAGSAPDEHVVAGLEPMRLVAEQHAIGGGQRQGVGGALLPAQMPRARHQLAVLHPAELGEGAVRRLVAPDALRGGKHRVAAVAFLVVAVVLVAMDDDFVADLPAPHPRPDRPDDARRVRSGDVIGLLVNVEHRHRLAERGPDVVVVHAGGHHAHDHLERARLGHLDLLELEGVLGFAEALLADHPGGHRLGQLTGLDENLGDLLQIDCHGDLDLACRDRGTPVILSGAALRRLDGDRIGGSRPRDGVRNRSRSGTAARAPQR
jgi:hypothetical protein